MSTCRISTRALAHLTRSTLTKPTTRPLSMTGPATFSSLLTSDKPAVRSRGPRLSPSEPTEAGRQFNTSRSLKAVNDSSTIDFMFIPDFDPDTGRAPVELRVPMLPWNSATASVKEWFTEAEEPVRHFTPPIQPLLTAQLPDDMTKLTHLQVMLPTIYTVSADGTHIHAPSAMSDMTDSDHIDFQGMASKVSAQLGSRSGGDEGTSMVRQVWTGLLEDILGPSGKHARA
jgi:hypothetical protein